MLLDLLLLSRRGGGDASTVTPVRARPYAVRTGTGLSSTPVSVSAEGWALRRGLGAATEPLAGVVAVGFRAYGAEAARAEKAAYVIRRRHLENELFLLLAL